MISETRQEIFNLMQEYADTLKLKNQHILEIGTAGDLVIEEINKPAGNYEYFGKNNKYETMDIISSTKPDYLEDICETTIPDNTFDLIICSQVLEHIWNFPRAVYQIHRVLKSSGYAIIDTPWQYHYHPEPDFKDYWRFSRDAYEKIFEKFKIIELKQLPKLTSVLLQK